MPSTKNIILTPEQARKADKATIDSGISGIILMERAGSAVANGIISRYSHKKAIILCGTGNNGGDGFVIARHLMEAGWNVEVQVFGTPDTITGDAREMYLKWNGRVFGFESPLPDTEQIIVVDAIFGTGKSRNLSDAVAAKIKNAYKSGHVIIAVDIPSWVCPQTGQVDLPEIKAERTYTFAAKKPCHVLEPSRSACGEVTVVDIGIDVSSFLAEAAYENTPHLWLNLYPWPNPLSHKYTRGHTAVFGGSTSHTGAARLAAMASLRIGSGLVTVLSPPDALTIYASTLLAIMVKELEGPEQITRALSNAKISTCLIGPGFGLGGNTESSVREIMASGLPAVLDADALSSFENRADVLRDYISKCPASELTVVITPHSGEFRRLFKTTYDKINDTKSAASMLDCVVIHKGADTVIASPSGQVVVSSADCPWLATAGSGDVLSGIVAGLMAQGMKAFDAACAGVWIHSEAGRRLGSGLISEDLPTLIPEILESLLSNKG